MSGKLTIPENAEQTEYDPTGTSLTDTNVQDAITSLSESSGGAPGALTYVYFNDSLTFSTTSTTYVDVIIVNLSDMPSGTYRIQWFFTSTNTSNNTESHPRVKFDGTSIPRSEKFTVGTETDTSSGVEYANFAGGLLTAQIETIVVNGNGSGKVESAFLEIQKVGSL